MPYAIIPDIGHFLFTLPEEIEKPVEGLFETIAGARAAADHVVTAMPSTKRYIAEVLEVVTAKVVLNSSVAEMPKKAEAPVAKPI